jgi:tetratricopeptide (TPR) repeat protein
MRVRLGVIAALIGLSLALSSTSAHGQKRKNRKPTIDRGIAQYNDLEYEQAIKTLEVALETPSEDKAKIVEGYKALALSYLALGKDDKTLEAFSKLLAIDPSYEFPATLSQQALALFNKARSALPKDPPAALEVKLDHEVDPLEPRPGAAISMTIAVTSDPDQRHRRVVVFHRTRGSSDFSSVWAVPAAETDKYSVTVSGSQVAGPAFEYYVVAVDESGAVVGELGSKTAPLALVISKSRGGAATPIYGKWWFWAGLGGAVVAGIVIATTVAGDDAAGGASVTVTVNPPAN